MRRSNVLQNVRIATEPMKVLPEDFDWVGSETWETDHKDPVVYTEGEMRALKREMKAAERASHRKGLDEGLSTGRREEQDRLRGQSEALQAITAAILEERGRLVAGAGRDLVRLALEMGGRIGRRSLELDGEAILRTVREALGRLGEARRVVVRLHPRDVETVSAQVAGLKELIPEGSHLALRSDAGISPGGCTVDTPELHFDATVEGLLGRFEEALSAWSDGLAPGASPVETGTAAPPTPITRDGSGPVDGGGSGEAPGSEREEGKSDAA